MICLPEWMASASLSGISMLNSCVACLSVPKPPPDLRPGAGLCVAGGRFPYLLDGHHNLNGIQAVQAKVVGKVCGGLNLHRVTQMMSVAHFPTAGALNHRTGMTCLRAHTLLASFTCKKKNY